MVGVAQLVRASDCGSEGREFKSPHPPQILQGIMKKIAVLIVGLVVLLPVLGISAEEAQRKYETPYFVLEYPSDWNMLFTGGVVAIAAPKETEEDDFQENVSVSIEPLGSLPTSLEEHMTFSLMDWQAGAKDFKVLDTSSAEIYNQDAIYVVYEKGEFKYKKYILFYKDRVYIVSYNGKTPGYKKYLNKAESIIHAIILKD